MAHRSKTTLKLIYAKQPRVVYTAIGGTGRRESREEYVLSSDIIATMEGYNDEVANGVIGKARKLCKGFHHDIKVETKVESGDPRDVICETVEKLGPDMLVMGSHGYGPIKRAFLGSVCNHCAQHAKCPVLIVKRPRSTA